MNGFVQSSILDEIEHYIIPPALGNRSGGLGAIAMARVLENKLQ